MIMSNKQLEEAIFGAETPIQSPERDEFVELVKKAGIIESLWTTELSNSSITDTLHSHGNYLQQIFAKLATIEEKLNKVK